MIFIVECFIATAFNTPRGVIVSMAKKNLDAVLGVVIALFAAGALLLFIGLMAAASSCTALYDHGYPMGYHCDASLDPALAAVFVGAVVTLFVGMLLLDIRARKEVK